MNDKPVSLIKIGGETYDPSTLSIPEDRKFQDAWQTDGKVVTVDWEKARQQFREIAVLDRAYFIGALAKVGVLSTTEAIAAAKGDWPDTFASALDGMDDETSFQAQLAWASATVIHRANPLIAMLAVYAKISAEQIDEMFGYDGE